PHDHAIAQIASVSCERTRQVLQGAHHNFGVGDALRLSHGGPGTCEHRKHGNMPKGASKFHESVSMSWRRLAVVLGFARVSLGQVTSAGYRRIRGYFSDTWLRCVRRIFAGSIAA